MKALHLTENEIQDFVLNTISSVDAMDHIGQCQQCSLKVAQYRMMFEGIKRQSDPVFDFDIAQLVMKKLPAKTTLSKDKSVAYLISIGSILVFAVLIYALKIYLRHITTSVITMSLSLIVTTALIVLALFIADMHKTFKAKINAFNYQ